VICACFINGESGFSLIKRCQRECFHTTGEYLPAPSIGKNERVQSAEKQSNINMMKRFASG